MSLLNHKLIAAARAVSAGGSWVPEDDAEYNNVFMDFRPDVASTISETSGDVTQLRTVTPSPFDTYHIVPDNGGQEPTTGVLSIGGLNALEFNGSNDRMSNRSLTDTSISNSDTFFVIGVIKKRPSSTGTGVIVSYGRNSVTPYFAFTSSESGGANLGFRFGNGFGVTSYTMTTDNDYLVSAYKPPGTNHAACVIRAFDEIKTHSGGGNSSSVGTGTKEISFGQLLASSNAGNYGMGRFLAMHTAPSTAFRQKLAGFLCHHYGIEAGLDAAHPYKSSPP